MQPFRRVCVVPLAMLTVLAAGCSSGGGVASGPQSSRVPVAIAGPESSRVSVTSVRSKLDGVRFDVRRDPG